MMKAKVLALVLGALLTVVLGGTALADGNNPANNGPATAGYEGQPGNQAGN